MNMHNLFGEGASFNYRAALNGGVLVDLIPFDLLCNLVGSKMSWQRLVEPSRPNPAPPDVAAVSKVS